MTQRATGGRIGLLAVVLAIASTADQRELWWGLLTGLAIIGILGDGDHVPRPTPCQHLGDHRRRWCQRNTR